RQLKRLVGEKTELMAVVKANAYGHGAVPVARTVLRSGASRLAVNRVIEGVQLRQAGIAAPILVLGYACPGEAEAIVQHDLTPTVNTQELALALSKASVARGKETPVHVKVDTGLGRFGLLPEEVVAFVKGLLRLAALRLEGIWTHFATADEADKGYTHRQFETYRQVVERLEGEGIHFPLHHVANSAATLDLPETHLDMVRCGITLYGLYPSTEVSRPIALRPAMSLKSRVARIRTLPAGSSISYGRTYTTRRPTPIALIPLGYGDGFHRLLSNRGAVLIGGKRASIVGRVCMDQFMVDVSGIEGVQEDDEVVVIGRQGGEEISAEEVAAWAETINYEVVTAITARVPRVYIGGGDAKRVDRAAAQ
ncbi:TPA: alanine racemase, partial [Candidatus Bipolaricaulota bacterium]|nr:alanine racemase [Candidatus Bipolaricaulota bacterium]